MGSRKSKVFTLDDGSQWTAKTLAAHLGMLPSTARSRLKVSSDPEKVLAKKCSKQYVLRSGGKRKYELSDGSYLTTAEIAEKVGIPKGVISNRLSRGQRDIKKLAKPINKHLNRYKTERTVSHSKEVQAEIAKRNFNDELSRLALRVI